MLIGIQLVFARGINRKLVGIWDQSRHKNDDPRDEPTFGLLLGRKPVYLR